MTISKMNDVRGRNERADAFFILEPLNSVLSLFGLNCIYRDGAVLKYHWSSSKITFLILLFSALNLINMYNKLYIWNGVISFTFSDAVQMFFLMGYFQYLLDLFYIHKYGRDHLLEYFRVYEHIDSVLGKIYFREIRRHIINLLISFSAISVITSVLDYAAWLVSAGLEVIVADFIGYIHIVIQNFGTADFISQLTQILYRLRSIGDLLKEYNSFSETIPNLKDIIDDNNGIGKEWEKTTSLKTINRYDFVITKLSGCYLLILKQCDNINAMYGLRVLLNSLRNFIDIITLLNLALRVSLGSLAVAKSNEIYPVLSSIIRVFACALMLVYELYMCQQNYNQINRIIRYVDYLLITKKLSFDAKDKLRNFRALVLSRPVQFHAVNFYKLDYPLILSWGSAIVTYTMILQNME